MHNTPASATATCNTGAPAPVLNVASAVSVARRWAARNAARAALRAARDAYERADEAAPGENTPAYIAARDRWAIARHRWHNFLEGW